MNFEAARAGAKAGAKAAAMSAAGAKAAAMSAGVVVSAVLRPSAVVSPIMATRSSAANAARVVVRGPKDIVVGMSASAGGLVARFL